MSEPISFTALFGVSKVTVDISTKIAKSLKLIQSIESKIELLMQVEFNAAWKTLIHFCNSTASAEQKNILLNNAREGFTKAIFFEKGERLFYAHLGLAICHYLLDDINNVKTALLDVTKISIYKDIYQQERDANFLFFNKYGFDTLKNTYNRENILNSIKNILQYSLYKKDIAVIKKYYSSRSSLITDISKKIDAEEKMIVIATKADMPSDVFKALELKSLELIRLQKEGLEIIKNI